MYSAFGMVLQYSRWDSSTEPALKRTVGLHIAVPWPWAWKHRLGYFVLQKKVVNGDAWFKRGMSGRCGVDWL